MHSIQTEETKEGKRMTKEELKKYQALKREQAQIEEMLWELQATMTAPKTAKIDGEPRGPSSGAGLENIVAKHLELEERYNAKLAEIIALRLAIEQAIDTLEPTERQLMRHRYIDGLTWEEVCVKMTYSWRQTHRIHGRALNKLRDQ
jgi:RNA polymerase sigma factor (sigma-70 family)